MLFGNAVCFCQFAFCIVPHCALAIAERVPIILLHVFSGATAKYVYCEAKCIEIFE